MKNLTFNEHKNEIIKRLELDENIRVLVGDDAIEYVKKNDCIYRKNHNKSLKWRYKWSNGLYLWWEDENTILLKKENIGTLAHELRHAWQYKNKEEEGFEFCKFKNEPYKSSRKELNANQFAQLYCDEIGLKKLANKYAKKVDKIISNIDKKVSR